MVPEAPEAEAAAGSETPPAVPFAKKWGKPLKIGLILLLVMAVEVGATYMLMPDGSGAAGKPGSHDEGGHDAPVLAETDLHASTEETTEVDLGEFTCTNGVAAPGMVIHVDFKLVGIVARTLQTQLEETQKEHEARLRQAVIKVSRSSSLNDLNDPGLGTLKRKIREEINKVLHKSYIIEVVISDFKTIEQ